MTDLLGVHHVALIVSDIDRSVGFYCDALGFTEVARHYRKERNSWKVDLRHENGMGIELFTFPEAPPRPSRPEARGLRHMAFVVQSVAATAARLTDLGLHVEGIRTDPYTGKKFTFLADPDGTPVELYEA